MIGERTEEIVLAGCMAVAAVSLTVLWLLARPASWLSRRIDRAVTLPAVSR